MEQGGKTFLLGKGKNEPTRNINTKYICFHRWDLFTTEDGDMKQHKI